MADQTSSPAHCYLERILTQDEVERVRSLLRQQGVHLPDAYRIGAIGSTGERHDCPFRYAAGTLLQVCSNGCHLAQIFGEHKV